MENCTKHNCPDCSFCQFCSETRCRACRKKCKAAKLSIPAQLELYNKLNPQAGDPGCPVFYKPSKKETAT